MRHFGEWWYVELQTVVSDSGLTNKNATCPLCTSTCEMHYTKMKIRQTIHKKAIVFKKKKRGTCPLWTLSRSKENYIFQLTSFTRKIQVFYHHHCTPHPARTLPPHPLHPPHTPYTHPTPTQAHSTPSTKSTPAHLTSSRVIRANDNQHHWSLTLPVAGLKQVR